MSSPMPAKSTTRRNIVILAVGLVAVVAGIIAIANSGSTNTATTPSTSSASTIPSTRVSSESTVDTATVTPTLTASAPHTIAPTTAPSTSLPRSTAKPTPTTPKPTKSGLPKGWVQYTVRPGDNLWTIARWFGNKGYQPVYGWNKSIIGKNPALIFPGQVIVVSTTGQMKVTTRVPHRR